MRGGKNCEDHPVFSKAHEEKAFNLSKKIWANVGGNGVGNGRAKVSGSRTGGVGLWKGGEKSEVERMGVDAEVEVCAGGFWSSGVCGSVSGLSLGKEIVKYGLELISDSKNVELEGKWKKLRVEEMELYLKKVGLIREQAKVVLGAMKS
ncbi:hypothetical protein RHGRI_004456 [Rhododendron griersonianum]|uniref:Uncharacterized protein n=1 Tax=Rhododendron griersonianum TaxID=479676 RepID=A0AAV6LAR8_9ERIC|nr:hypothetical protein RHGRI_004456 [Rhododendron griersonianum]